MTSKRYFFLILILGTLTALGPFSIDMYLPAFPAIAKTLHTTTNQVGLSLSSFFIGISAGQLLYGPLMDRYGRKRPLYVGLSLYTVACVGCFLSRSVETLVIIRFIQAIGSCAAGVAAMAMVRDIFPVKDNAKVFALLTLVLGASPLIAPTAGGYLSEAFGWQSVFVVLLIIAAVIFVAVIFSLPESYKPDPSFSLKPGPIINNFLQVIREPRFFTYAVAGSLAFSGLFAYVAGSPLVFMDIYRISGRVYGWIFAGLSIGFIGSSQVNSLLIRHFASEQIVKVALICQVLVSILFFVGALNHWYDINLTIVMIFLFLCGVGVSSPNSSALSLAPFDRNAGSASSLMGAMQLGIGSLVSYSISLFSNHSTVPMTAVMAVSSSLALIVLFLGLRQIKRPIEASVQTVMPGH